MPGQAICGTRADEHGGDLSADRRIVGYSVSPGAYCYSESVVREQYERFSGGSGTVAAIVVVRGKD
jgi:hypothetical protein